MTIETTTDYDQFNLIKGNRTISRKKVERLKNDFSSGLNLFPYCPIIVSPASEGKNIVDGQHRFTASKELKEPIYYVVATGIKLRDIARMNSNTDKWSLNDFMECYIKLGQGDYKIFKQFKSAYNLNYSTAIALLLTGNVKAGGTEMDKFKDGLFKVNHLEKSKRLLELSDSIFKKFTFYRDGNLLMAVSQLMRKNKWNVDRMKDKVNKNVKMLDKQANAKSYIFMLERIYNVGLQNRQVIY